MSVGFHLFVCFLLGWSVLATPFLVSPTVLWIRIRIAVKCWIGICNELIADQQHWPWYWSSTEIFKIMQIKITRYSTYVVNLFDLWKNWDNFCDGFKLWGSTSGTQHQDPFLNTVKICRSILLENINIFQAPILKTMSYPIYSTSVKGLCWTVRFVQNDRSLMVFASSLNVAEVEQVFTQEEGRSENGDKISGKVSRYFLFDTVPHGKTFLFLFSFLCFSEIFLNLKGESHQNPINNF